MSITDMYREKLEEQKEKREKVAALSREVPDCEYIVRVMDAEIRDTETRISKLTSISESIQCLLCNKWVSVEDSEEMVKFNDKDVCPGCLKALTGVKTTQEAEELWGLAVGTIKQDCRRGKLDEFIEVGFIRKSGKYWLVHDIVGDYYKGRN